MSHQKVVSNCHSVARYAKALPEGIDETIVDLTVTCAAWVAVANIIHVTIDLDLLPAADGSTGKFPRYLCSVRDGATGPCERIHAIVICRRPLQSAALFLVVVAAWISIIDVTQPSTGSAPTDRVARAADVALRGAFRVAVWTCGEAIEQSA